MRDCAPKNKREHQIVIINKVISDIRSLGYFDPSHASVHIPKFLSKSYTDRKPAILWCNVFCRSTALNCFCTRARPTSNRSNESTGATGQHASPTRMPSRFQSLSWATADAAACRRCGQGLGLGSRPGSVVCSDQGRVYSFLNNIPSSARGKLHLCVFDIFRFRSNLQCFQSVHRRPVILRFLLLPLKTHACDCL